MTNCRRPKKNIERKQDQEKNRMRANRKHGLLMALCTMGIASITTILLNMSWILVLICTAILSLSMYLFIISWLHMRDGLSLWNWVGGSYSCITAVMFSVKIAAIILNSDNIMIYCIPAMSLIVISAYLVQTVWLTVKKIFEEIKISQELF